MNKIKKRGSRIIFITIVLSMIGIGSAQAIPISSILKNTSIGKVYDELIRDINSVGNYVKDFAKSLDGDMQVAIDETLGELGIPNIVELRKKIGQNASNSDLYLESVGRKRNEAENEVNRAIINAKFNQEGQQETKRKTKLIQENIEDIQRFSVDAQNSVSTQDVVKKLTQEQQKIGEILGAMQSHNLQSETIDTLQLETSNRIANNIYEQRQSNEREVANQATYNEIITSRARLF